jgi:predicted phage terminase large subunit-like protein
VLTRFNNPNLGALILVMHRLAPDDPSADMEASADFQIKLPLIAETVEKFRWNGRIMFHRQPGDPLNPDRFNLHQIERLRASVPPHVYASQYQQRPTAGGSGMLSLDKWRRYDPTKAPAFELLMHSWDIGATTTGNASVCTTWGLTKDNEGRDVIYLLNVQRLRLELPEVLASIKTANRRDRPSLIVIDERGVGLGVYQELEREGYRHIKGSMKTSDPLEREGQPAMKPSASKIARFGRAALQIADSRVLLPTHASWLDHFLNEVAGFPNIADKDQVDSMTQLVGSLDPAIFFARLFKSRGLQ